MRHRARSGIWRDSELVGWRCNGCTRELPLEEFHLDRNNKTSGRQRKCKECCIREAKCRAVALKYKDTMKLTVVVPKKLIVNLKTLLGGGSMQKFVVEVLEEKVEALFHPRQPRRRLVLPGEAPGEDGEGAARPLSPHFRS